MIDSARESLVLIDDHGEILFANVAAGQLWGYDEGEMAGLNLKQIFAPQFEFLQVQQGAAIAGVDTDAEALRADGVLFPVAVNLRELDLDDGVCRLLSASDDFTGREREQSQLQRHSFDALEQFAGGLAHELNNILTGVLGNIHLAMEECGRRGRLQPALLEGAQNAGLRARELTRELLEFARGDRPEQCAVNLVDLIQENCHIALSGSRSKVEYSFGDDLAAAYLDYAQFGQVIHQVVTFVDELTGHSGKLDIHCENRHVVSDEDTYGGELLLGDYCALSIQAEGIRLTAEEVDHLFQPYARRGDSISGLALSICRAIISRHGGVIQASAAAGGKLTVELIIPASSDLPTRTVTPLETGVPNIGGAHILVMDDQQMVRTVLQRSLEALGHRVTACGDGIEAIDIYAEALERGDRFDLVFLDISVPGGLGAQETCEELIQMDNLATCVVISGDTSDELMLDHGAFGFVGRLDKPFDVNQLSTLVDDIVGDREDYVPRIESENALDEEEEDALALPFEDNIVAFDFNSPPDRF
ncbi:MAG: two-component system cell cycle sensor histidine kinase/response regulator CckA [Verrucomicrobiales bacterium]